MGWQKYRMEVKEGRNFQLMKSIINGRVKENVRLSEKLDQRYSEYIKI